MLTKLSQQQLEVIRGKYLEQNKSLLQQNSTLLMKCNLLENKISQLLKENTQLRTDKLKFESRIDHELIALETGINDQLKDFSRVMKNLKTVKEVGVKPTKIETSKPPKMVVENSIPEEDEEEEVEMNVEKDMGIVSIANVAEVVENSPGKQLIPIEIAVEDNEVPNKVPKDKPNEKQHILEDISKLTELSVKIDEDIVVSSSTPIASPVKTESIDVVKLDTKVVNKESLPISSSSDLIIDAPRIKRRKKSEINYKLPSLKNKMRRNGDKKWVGAVYDKDDDDLITVDKRRDSFGNWLPDREKVVAKEWKAIQSDKDVKGLKSKPEVQPIHEDEKKKPVEDIGGKKPDQNIEEEVVELTSTEIVLGEIEFISNNLSDAGKANSPVITMNEDSKSKAKISVNDKLSKSLRPTTRRDSIHPRVTKKTPLSDITNTQNIKPNSTVGGGSKLKSKSKIADLSVFDFIDDDNVERRTIFNKRRNSMI